MRADGPYVDELDRDVRPRRARASATRGRRPSGGGKRNQRRDRSERPRGLLLRLAREVRPYWRGLTLLVVLDLLAVPLFLLLPLPLKIVADSVLGSQPAPGFLSLILPHSAYVVLVFACLLQVLVVVLSQLQTMFSLVAAAAVGERLTTAFRNRLFQHVQRLSLTFHDTRGIADSIFRIEYDAISVRHLVQEASVPLLSASVTLVAMLVVIARIDWLLAVMAAVVTPPLYVLARSYNRRMKASYLNVRELESRALNVVQEALAALRVVKAFGRQYDELRRFADRSGRGATARVRLSISEGLFGLLVNGCTGLGTAIVLFIGAEHVRSGALTLGSLLLVVSYLAQLYRPLTTIGEKFSDAQASLAGVHRTFELLDEQPEVIERPYARSLSRAQGQLEFRDVHFAYGGGKGALQGVSLFLPPGTRLGVAGRTGAGKSTLVSLLLRFYDPVAGAIYLDGVDLRDYRLSDLRNQFAIVLQDTILFSTSIEENIRYARPDATLDEVIEAARAANADEFIRDLPDGYRTLVGERGMRLSGGERQRIALARAFLKDAPILILDEATSSVDVATEAGIMQAMERLMEGRTTVMIAHRLSTLESCDITVTLDGGQVMRVRVDEERRRGYVPRDESPLEVVAPGDPGRWGLPADGHPLTGVQPGTTPWTVNGSEHYEPMWEPHDFRRS